MSIEGITSSADIYSEDSTHGQMKNLDDLGVKWEGKTVLENHDEVGIKTRLVFSQFYQQTAQINSDEFSQKEFKHTQFIEESSENEFVEEVEPSPLLYHYDPISGTYYELIGAEGSIVKSVAKGCRNSGRAVKKGVREGGRKIKKAGKAAAKVIVPTSKDCKEIVKMAMKVQKPIAKAEAKTVEWVKEHPVETAVIVVAVAAVIITAGAASGPAAEAIAVIGESGAAKGALGAIAGAGAAAAAANTGSNNDHKKGQNKDHKPLSPPPPAPRLQINTPPSISSDPVSELSPFNPTSPYTSSITPQIASPSNLFPRDPLPQPAFPPSNIRQHEASAPSIPKASNYNPPTITSPTPHPLLSNLPQPISQHTPVELLSPAPHVATPIFVTNNPSSAALSVHISPVPPGVESLIASESARSSITNYPAITSYQPTHFEGMRAPTTTMKPAIATQNAPNLNQNTPIQNPNPAIIKKQEIQPVSWAKGVPIWQEGDPLPPEGMTLVAICARKGGVLLNDPTREAVLRPIEETGGHAWLEFVESNGNQSSLSTQRGDNSVCETDIADYKHDNHTIRINYLIPTSTAELIKQAANDHASKKYNLFFHNCVHTSHKGAKVAGLDEFFSVIKPTYSEDGPAHANEILTLPSAVYSQIEKKIDELRGSDHPLITPPSEQKNEIVWIHLATDDPYAPSTFSPNEAFRHENKYLQPTPTLQTKGNFGDSKEETNMVP